MHDRSDYGDIGPDNRLPEDSADTGFGWDDDSQTPDERQESEALAESDCGLECGDGEAAPLKCLQPVSGMGISEDTLLCPGKYELEDPTGEGAIAVVGDGVALKCDGTEIFSASDPVVGDAVASVGIRISGRKGVALSGCAVHGFHYGVQVKDSSAVSVVGCDLRLNLDDDSQKDVGDSVQGGAISLVNAHDSVISDNTLSYNWNTVELRQCTGVEVADNVAHHASNAGLLMLDSHGCTATGNDFSGAIRGVSAGPGDWAFYQGVTFGTASVILDSGSSGNLVAQNDATGSGTGVAIRAAVGACPEGNTIQSNDASFAADAGISSACNYNVITDNVASDCEIGLSLGGSDGVTVESNRAERNVLDGISVQGGSSRHNLYTDNLLRDNGRAGILISGRSYPPTAGIGTPSGEYFNASHGLLLANRFEGNGACDLFLSAVRGFHVLATCGQDGGFPTIVLGPDVEDFFKAGWCSQGWTFPPPKFDLPEQGGQVGKEAKLKVQLGDDPFGKPIKFYWLVQKETATFGEGPMPSPVVSGEVGMVASAYFKSPGIHSLGVTGYDGKGAALKTSVAYVAPAGNELAESNSASWQHGCGTDTKTTLSDDADMKAVGKTSLRTDTECPYTFWLVFPTPAPAWTLSTSSAIHMYVRSHNPNGGGWQGNFPRMELADAAGKKRVVYPDWNMLGSSEGRWIYVVVPMVEAPGWKVEDGGADLSAITSITMLMDTHDWGAYQVWIDGCVVVP